MSDLLGDLDIEFPKTVSACHAEIRRLSELIADADKQLDAKDDTIDELQTEIDEIEDGKEDDCDQQTESAVNAFLDEIERTGPLRFDVPNTDRVNRAIVALHDLVGRKP